MYESYYGLNSKPFQLTPDPAFFYASTWHKRAMSYLQYGLSQAEGFIVITGGIGTGKTTIANSLLAEIEEDIVAGQIVTPKLNPDELVKMVGAKFGLPVEGKSKADILKALEEFLFQLHKQGKRALLLVDEAQNLPLETIEELRMLSNYQEAGQPLLQSFLLGQEELQPILRAPNMEQFRQRIVASCHLAPLTEEECKSYIEYRLHHAGWDGKTLFTESAHKLIYQFTRGVPRKINTLLDRIMLFGFLEELELLDESAVDSVIDEVKSEMFEPEPVQMPGRDAVAPVQQSAQPSAQPAQTAGSQSSETQPSAAQELADVSNLVNPNAVTRDLTPNGNEIRDAAYYKQLLGELVDALDGAIQQKVKLTQYVDKMLKKKYGTYVRMKEEK